MYVIIDINGAQSVYDKKIPANFIAILPPDEKTLEERLKGRGTESADVIEGRLETAKTETRRINNSNFFNFKIFNDNLDKTVLEMEEKLKILYPHLK